MNSKSAETEHLNSAELPRHIAIIMDGNGRWAKKRLLNRVKGHEKGSEVVRTIVETCREFKIPILTLYAFSTENWQRPKTEINALMRILKNFLLNERSDMLKNNIRLNVIGQPHRLPEDVRSVLEQVMYETSGNDGLLLNLALSYGGRTEITDMVKSICRKIADRAIKIEDIDEDLIAHHLYTRNIPDPDILIRTSGEMRISNFLLWQLAYTEMFITSTLWPDFTPNEFKMILKQYHLRDRRFGKVKVISDTD